MKTSEWFPFYQKVNWDKPSGVPTTDYIKKPPMNMKGSKVSLLIYE